MIDERDERLLQDELEGLASPEGAARLRERLARSPEVRERRRELQDLARALEQLPLEEPPADLRDAVMAAIAADARTAPARGPGRELRGGPERGRAGLAWAYSFLAGAVAGGLLIALVTGNLSPRTRTDFPVAGAMLPGTGGRIDHRELRLGAARLALATRRTAEGVRGEFEFAQAPGAELTLAFDGAALQPAGLRWAPPAAGQAVLEEGAVRLRLVRDGRGAVLLSPLPAGDVPVTVSFRHSGGSLQAVLHTADGHPGR